MSEEGREGGREGDNGGREGGRREGTKESGMRDTYLGILLRTFPGKRVS